MESKDEFQQLLEKYKKHVNGNGVWGTDNESSAPKNAANPTPAIDFAIQDFHTRRNLPMLDQVCGIDTTNINNIDANGHTPLGYALLWNDTGLVNYLVINFGADVNHYSFAVLTISQAMKNLLKQHRNTNQATAPGITFAQDNPQSRASNVRGTLFNGSSSASGTSANPNQSPQRQL